MFDKLAVLEQGQEHEFKLHDNTPICIRCSPILYKRMILKYINQVQDGKKNNDEEKKEQKGKEEEDKRKYNKQKKINFM